MKIKIYFPSGFHKTMKERTAFFKRLLTQIDTHSTKYLVDAALAQLVEQRTENPCVLGSIPRGGKMQRTKETGVYCKSH